jgi:hypothetical protein
MAALLREKQPAMYRKIKAKTLYHSNTIFFKKHKVICASSYINSKTMFRVRITFPLFFN